MRCPAVPVANIHAMPPLLHAISVDIHCRESVDARICAALQAVPEGDSAVLTLLVPPEMKEHVEKYVMQWAWTLACGPRPAESVTEDMLYNGTVMPTHRLPMADARRIFYCNAYDIVTGFKRR